MSVCRVLAGRYSFLLKVLYNPQAFFTHAVLLDQAFAHCPIFPTAASRRSLGRVSVPVWLIILSDQLPVDALVGRYPTNKLIGRETLPDRNSFVAEPCDSAAVFGISSRFQLLSQRPGQVPHALLTRSPLGLPEYCYSLDLVRLACVKHAASVRPEPGSNSPTKTCRHPTRANPCREPTDCGEPSAPPGNNRRAGAQI